MHTLELKLRHRELTQEVFDIGDEVATYLENLAQAVSDYDAELVDDCWEEFSTIVTEAKTDSRRAVAELIGLRQALVCGVKSGTITAYAHEKRSPTVARPTKVDAEYLASHFPLSTGPIIVGELHGMLTARCQCVADQLRSIGDWVIDQTAVAADSFTDVVLPVMFARADALAGAAVDGWVATVGCQPAFCRAMRGTHPPEFLLERARVDAVVARVKAKLATRSKGFAS